MNEHDQLIILKTQFEHLKATKDFLEMQYNQLFDYFNDKYPDEMIKYLNMTSER